MTISIKEARRMLSGFDQKDLETLQDAGHSLRALLVKGHADDWTSFVSKGHGDLNTIASFLNAEASGNLPSLSESGQKAVQMVKDQLYVAAEKIDGVKQGLADRGVQVFQLQPSTHADNADPKPKQGTVDADGARASKASHVGSLSNQNQQLNMTKQEFIDRFSGHIGEQSGDPDLRASIKTKLNDAIPDTGGARLLQGDAQGAVREVYAGLGSDTRDALFFERASHDMVNSQLDADTREIARNALQGNQEAQQAARDIRRIQLDSGVPEAKAFDPERVAAVPEGVQADWLDKLSDKVDLLKKIPVLGKAVAIGSVVLMPTLASANELVNTGDLQSAFNAGAGELQQQALDAPLAGGFYQMYQGDYKEAQKEFLDDITFGVSGGAEAIYDAFSSDQDQGYANAEAHDDHEDFELNSSLVSMQGDNNFEDSNKSDLDSERIVPSQIVKSDYSFS